MTAVQELGTHISSMIGNMTAAQELGTQISSMLGNMTAAQSHKSAACWEI